MYWLSGNLNGNLNGFFGFLIRNGHLEIVQFLVNGNHCQVNAVDNYGWTALRHAAE